MKKLTSLFLVLSLLAGACLFALPASASDSVLIDYGSKWHYVAYEEDPAAGLVHEEPEGWLDGTDTETWETGTAPIGAAQWGSAVTRLPYQYFSAFFRKTFKVNDLSKITSLTMYIKYDENPTVYLNGTMVWTASGYIDSRYVEVPLDDAIELLQEGENTLQVALSNVNGGAVIDLALICVDAFEPLLPIESEWEYLSFERYEPGEGEDPNAVQNEAPDGWLDGTDVAYWEYGSAPFAGSAWPNWRTQTQFTYGCFDAYLRTTFTLEDVENVTYLVLKVIYDEDPVIYLNGVQIWSATGYKDSDYQLLFINDQIGKLQAGTNTVCVYFRNKWNGGGSVFDMGLYYNQEVIPVEYYDEDGWVAPASASCTNVYSFGALNDPANILDGSQDTVCGSGFNAENPQTFTVHLQRPEMIHTVYLQCKFEGEYGDGTYGYYDVYAVYGGEETLIGEDVPAIIAREGGYTLVLDEAVPAEAITVKVKSWEGPGWACLADIKLKATGEIPEAPRYDSEGHILNMTATCGGFANFGDINKPENVLDMDGGTVCGSAFNEEVEQFVQVNFPNEELVSEIYVQCKNEGTTDNPDGSRGTYDVYTVLDGVETLVESDVPAFTDVDGGYTVYLAEPVAADGVKVVITSWQGDKWACVADIAVTAVPQSDVDPMDVNADGEVNITDVTALLDLLTQPGASCDLNSDGETNISDVTTLLTHLA